MEYEPTIKIMCDSCSYEAEYEMCALVRNSYDLRYLPEQLKRDNWKVDGDSHICESCQEEK